MHPPGTRPGDISAENSIFGRDRRRAFRHRVHTPAYASLSGSSQGTVLELCEILDISQSGMCIQASSPMKVNRLLPLVIDLSETGVRIHTTGHVVWSESSGKTGIRFPELPEDFRVQLEQWLAANAAVDDPASVSYLAPESGEPVLLRRPLVARPASASGYTSLVNEWSDLEREVDLFGPELEPALQLIAQRALTLTWATGAAIALMNKLKPSELICRARSGTDSPELGARLQAGSGFSGECVRSATTLKCDDAQTDSRVDRKSCRALGIRSLIACPVKRRTGEVIGILEVFSPETAAFWDNDCTVLERMARIIAAAVGRAEHARPDVLAVSSSEDEHERTLFADALRSVQDHEFSSQTFSFSRRVLLLLTGIAAITLTIWLIAPWIAPWVRTSLVSFAPSSGPQSAEASPSRNSYTGTSARDLRGFALRGDATAQYALGMRYASGDGVKQDYHEALVWFLKSADQGNARAASKLAAFFWSGRGSPRDYGKAYFWGLLAQAAGDEQGRVIVINSAPHLSPAQTAQEQQQADKWLHDHHIQSSSEAAQ